MQEDRVRLRQKAPVFQLDRRHLADRVLGEKFGAARRTVQRRYRNRPERPAKMAQRQPNLIAVAGIVLLIERQHPASFQPVLHSIGSPAWVLRESSEVKEFASDGIATSAIVSGVQPPLRCTIRTGRIWPYSDNSPAR